MKLIRGLSSLQSQHHGTVATIGNFDGVHLGHQAVLGQLKKQASVFGADTTVISFEPLPNEYFQGANAPGRLVNFRDKYQLIKQQGVDQWLCLRFNKALATMPADRFIRDVLVDGLGIRLLVVGDDFRFGKDRKGDFSLLQHSGSIHGFEVRDTNTFVCDEEERVSSTRIRQCLFDGEFDTAERLLGRRFTMSGKVIHGDKRGRELGFPTLNIRANRPVSPLKGVFAVEVEGIGQGVANVGTRPTFNDRGFLIEVHLLDFSGDLYGKRLTVNWLKKLRAEKRFESFEELKQQIGQDILDAQAFFAG